MIRWCWLLLGLAAFPDAVDAIQVGPLLVDEQCYASLNGADEDGDGRITGNEYISVVEDFGYPEGVAQDFNDLPLLLQGTFNVLACQCTLEGGDNECCVGDNAHIRTPGDDVPDEDRTYFTTVCTATNTAVQVVLTSEPPSFAPSEAPSESPTGAPTLGPTLSPTLGPTLEPTLPPSPAPTVSPSLGPTPGPTLGPTFGPTLAPSPGPTLAPSPGPTIAPSPGPTQGPTLGLTPAPTDISTTGPTPSPTAPTTGPPVPTLPPTEIVPVATSYVIRVTNGRDEQLTEEEVDNLEAAMDIVAVDVTNELYPPQARIRRKLAVTTVLPTVVTGFIDTACPVDTPEQDSCEDVSASVSLRISEDEDVEEVEESYREALDAAIASGALQEALLVVNPDSRIAVLSAATPPAPTPAPVDRGGGSGLSGGATAGIVVAAAVGVIAAAGFFVVRRRRHDKDQDPFLSTQALAGEGTDRELVSSGSGQLGASQADYGKKKKTSVKAFQSLEEGEEADIPVPSASEQGADSSSAAGSSGWSSSAGVSSLNTGSADSLDFGGGGGAGAAAAGAATLAAIGASSGIARDKDETGVEREPVPGIPSVTRSDLDKAIEAGDWAAVGATAALLAATSDSQSQTSGSRLSGTTGSREGSTISSIDAARAAELDHLVDAGDWEGVVLAAAKFEAAEEESSRTSSRSHSGSKESTGGSTGAASSGYSASEVSESPSKAQKREEIRAEVESLVRRVVPEEIDNVDEMMLQFKGREEELVETLRTMQERAVAQKARLAGQKTAKREARLSARQGGGPPVVSSAAAAAAAPSAPTSDAPLSPTATAGVSAGVAAALGVAAGITAGAKRRDDGSKDSSSPKGSGSGAGSGGSSSTSRDSGGGKRRRTALELAIEAGDWEAVGEAAAMMSDTSVTTASSGEINAIAEAGSSSDSSGRRKGPPSGVNADRAKELDEMIDRGDWTGVVAAASRFSRSDAETSTLESGSQSASASMSAQSLASGSAQPSTMLGAAAAGGDTESYEGLDKDKALKEEQDALAQAEIWMAIAEQSKQEGSTDVGASDAADWAIARSLSALRTAEERGELKKKSSKSKKGSGSSDSAGDRSV